MPPLSLRLRTQMDRVRPAGSDTIVPVSSATKTVEGRYKVRSKLPQRRSADRGPDRHSPATYACRPYSA